MKKDAKEIVDEVLEKRMRMPQFVPKAKEDKKPTTPAKKPKRK